MKKQHSLKSDEEKTLGCDSRNSKKEDGNDYTFLQNIVTQLENTSLTSFEELKDSLHYYQHEYKGTMLIVYQTVDYALRLLELRVKYSEGFSNENLECFVNDYLSDYYLFDQYYRLFCEACDLIEDRANINTDGLKVRIDYTYNCWYMSELTNAWTPFVENNLLSSWEIPDIHQKKLVNQTDFYSEYIERSKIRGSRSYVIVSDALRYEVAKELFQSLNETETCEVTLDSMLSVLPSISSLGMAALLPHDNLNVLSDTTGVHVRLNNKPTLGLHEKTALLEDYGGVAIKASRFLNLDKSELEKFVDDKEVIYIYHDVIGFTGDFASSEAETFKACREAIDEIQLLVATITKNHNEDKIFITTDHGFLYSHSDLHPSDVTSLSKCKDTFLSRQRFILTKHKSDDSNVWGGDLANTCDSMTSGSFCIPKGKNLFHSKGGKRFTHGGAMPQEVLIPLIKINS